MALRWQDQRRDCRSSRSQVSSHWTPGGRRRPAASADAQTSVHRNHFQHHIGPRCGHTGRVRRVLARRQKGFPATSKSAKAAPKAAWRCGTTRCCDGRAVAWHEEWDNVFATVLACTAPGADSRGGPAEIPGEAGSGCACRNLGGSARTSSTCTPAQCVCRLVACRLAFASWRATCSRQVPRSLQRMSLLVGVASRLVCSPLPRGSLLALLGGLIHELRWPAGVQTCPMMFQSSAENMSQTYTTDDFLASFSLLYGAWPPPGFKMSPSPCMIAWGGLRMLPRLPWSRGVGGCEFSQGALRFESRLWAAISVARSWQSKGIQPCCCKCCQPLLRRRPH